jgi:hypothetical protein
MKKAVLLMLVASAFVFAKTSTPAKSPKKTEPSKVAEEVQPVAEESAAEDVQDTVKNESTYTDSTFTLYIHPMNFIAPYSHFWAGVCVPDGLTDYPAFNLSFEWKMMEKISLMSMPHYVRVDRSGDGYKISDIGLQESFRLYGVGGERWRFFQAGMVLSHLHVDTEDAGDFDGWLFGLMFNAGVKLIVNDGQGFLGRFALSLDVGAGYAWVSDFDASRKGSWFELDKGVVIDVNVALGFQI